jgi:hypothetical protein
MSLVGAGPLKLLKFDEQSIADQVHPVLGAKLREDVAHMGLNRALCEI